MKKKKISSPIVYFYLPKCHFPCKTWQKIWQEALPFIQQSSASLAAQHWIYQTWYLLQQAGVDCQLTTEFPSHGIVLVWNAYSEPAVQENISPDIFLVDLTMHELIFPKAHLHLVQNKKRAEQIPNAIFVPHWPQPRLIPRDPKRGTRFENIYFFGLASNLAPELLSEEWFQILRHKVGVFFDLQKCHSWHDYSNVDAVVAIRTFSDSAYLHKPATKLYNAWLAGVPFIGGMDSAYAAEGQPGIDYLVAKTPEAILAHLKRLKTDLAFRNELICRGNEASQTITSEATLLCWKKLIQETLPSQARRVFNKA